METLYKVYALLDKNKCITRIESTAFFGEEWLIENGFIKIDEGSNGDMYGHAQPNYLRMKYGKTMYDDKFHPNFKYVDEKVVELTKEEKEALFHTPIQEPTFEEIQNEINIDTDFRLSCLELGI